MQSHGGPQLVAELQQCLKKQVRRDDWRGHSRSASRSPEPTALNLSVTSRHRAKKGEIPLERGGSLGGVRLVVFLLEHARKMGVNKHQK
jgi:hypothetical protein